MLNKLYFISLLLLMLLSTGCDSNNSNPLRIAHNSWPGYEPLVLAESKSLYRDIEVINYRVGSATEAIKAFEHNIVDVVAITLDEALLLQSRIAEPLVVLTVMDVSHGGDAVVAKQGINDISDLRGKRVGVESTALGGFFLSRALESVPQLSIEELQVVHITYNHHKASYINNEVDAVVTFEPVKTALVKLGGNIIFDSSMIPNEIVDVLVTRQSLTEQRSDDLKRLVSGYFLALKFIQKHPGNAQSMMAEFEGVGLSEFQKSLSGIKIPDETQNQLLLGGEQPQLQSTVEKLQKFMDLNAMGATEGRPSLIISDKFIPVSTHVK